VRVLLNLNKIELFEERLTPSHPHICVFQKSWSFEKFSMSFKKISMSFEWPLMGGYLKFPVAGLVRAYTTNQALTLQGLNCASNRGARETAIVSKLLV